MAHAYHHSLSTVRRWGGSVDDYLAIHEWLDASKMAMADHRHRALRHHSLGVFWCEERFGVTITNSNGVEVPVRLIAEQHIKEDLGFIPSVEDWLKDIPGKFWMTGRRLNISSNGNETKTPSDTDGCSGGHIQELRPEST